MYAQQTKYGMSLSLNQIKFLDIPYGPKDFSTYNQFYTGPDIWEKYNQDNVKISHKNIDALHISNQFKQQLSCLPQVPFSKDQSESWALITRLIFADVLHHEQNTNLAYMNSKDCPKTSVDKQQMKKHEKLVVNAIAQWLEETHQPDVNRAKDFISKYNAMSKVHQVKSSDFEVDKKIGRSQTQL